MPRQRHLNQRVLKSIKNFTKDKEDKLFFNYFCKDYYHEKVIPHYNNIKEQHYGMVKSIY